MSQERNSDVMAPCPFCGSTTVTTKASQESWSAPWTWAARCGICEAAGSAAGTLEEATRLWNSRPVHPATLALDALRARVTTLEQERDRARLVVAQAHRYMHTPESAQKSGEYVALWNDLVAFEKNEPVPEHLHERLGETKSALDELRRAYDDVVAALRSGESIADNIGERERETRNLNDHGFRCTLSQLYDWRDDEARPVLAFVDRAAAEDEWPTMQWFGKNWGAALCTSAAEAPLPQTPCDRCGKAFTAADEGVIVPFFGGPGDPPELAYHLGCWRDLLGLKSDGTDAT